VKTERARYLEWARDCQKASVTNHLLTLARSQLTLDANRFDEDPWLLNCQNGTIHLRTGKLHPHKPEDLLTMMAGTSYDPEAKAPRWEAFIYHILGGSVPLVRFFQKAAGYSLTGLTIEQVFFLLYGTGQNGKSTAMSALMEMFGDYAKALPPKLLVAQKFEQHPTQLADLFRVRLSTSSEVNADTEWNEERIKALTGGDKIKARRMREDYWEYDPMHKFWLNANHLPDTRDNSEGFWRRVRMIPFTVSIPKEKQDPMLMVKLREELPGIMAWAVHGCLMWQQEGLESPEEVRLATNQYRDRQDPFRRFLDECCDIQADARVRTSELQAAYDEWARGNRETMLNSKELMVAMLERGFQSRKSSVMYYEGLHLK
jgi:putative DNA primase/helicase